MNTRDKLRIAAGCSFIYVVVFVALQILLPQLLHGDHLPDQTKGRLDDDVASLLQFVSRHRDYFSTGYLLVAANYLLLLGSAIGTFLLLFPHRPRTARMVLGIGCLSIAGTVVSQLIGSHQWLQWASLYTGATSKTAQLAAIHGFESDSTGYQVSYLVATTGTAVWLALLGVTVLRVEGTRSIVGWTTIAAGLLLLSQFPSLPVWALGAGIGLWRVSSEPGAPGTPIRWPRATRGPAQIPPEAEEFAAKTAPQAKGAAAIRPKRSGRRRRR